VLGEHVLDLATEVLGKILDLGHPGPDHGALFLVGHLPPLTLRHPSGFHVPHNSTDAHGHEIGSGSLGTVLLIAAQVLGDINRWWIQSGRHLADGPELGEVYRLLHQVSVEAEAAWSVLPDRGDGSRVFSIHTALLESRCSSWNGQETSSSTSGFRPSAEYDAAASHAPEIGRPASHCG